MKSYILCLFRCWSTNQVGNTKDGKTCTNSRRYIALKFQYFHELPCKYHNYRDLCWYRQLYTKIGSKPNKTDIESLALEYRSSFDHVTKFMATLNRSLVAKLRSLALVLAAPLTEKKIVFVQQLNCLILLSYLVLN